MLAGSQGSDQLAELCARLPVLRRLARGPVGARALAVLEQAVAAARVGAPIDTYLERLGVRAEPEPDTVTPEPATVTPEPPPDTVEEEPEPDAAVPGPWDAPRSALPPRLDVGASEYSPGRYVCPRGACTRQEYREVGAGLPTCAIFDQALRFTEER